MAKALLLDTNISSEPIYNYLLKKGLDVYVVGNNPNDFLAKYAQNYIQLDYTNIDQIRQLIQKESIDYIIPGCNDRSYFVAAELNENQKYSVIDTIETTEVINNKERFREFSEKYKLPVPQILNIEQVESFLPVIVKPVDAYSGRGMTIISEFDENKLNSAIRHAQEFSISGQYLIEEYVDGQLYSHSAFIKNGKVAEEFIVEEYGTANPFVVDTSRVVDDFSISVLDKIRGNIDTIAQALGLQDGLFHTQFIMKEQTYWLIEVTRRCPGDLYSQLIEFATGFNYVENYIRPFLNKTFNFNTLCNPLRLVMRHTISQSGEQYFTSTKFLVPFQIEKYVQISQSGDYVKASPIGRIGLLFTVSNNEKQFNELFVNTLDRKIYIIE